MLGVKLLGLLLLITQCIHIRGQSTNQLNSLCALAKDGTMLANPSNCESYYYCKAGVATSQTCGVGKAFNKDQQACVSASQMNCQTVDINPCEGKVDTWVPNSSNCNAYYYCDTKSVAHAANCPNGQSFSVNQCVYGGGCLIDGTDDSITVVTGDICYFMPNGQFFASPSDCTAYNICLNGELNEGSCGNYYYNVQTQTCVYKSSYTCPQTSVPSEIGQPCSTKGVKTAITVTNAPCNQYYECDGTKNVLKQCSKGLYFDTTSKTCTSETNAVNANCNRCTDHNSGFVSSCTASNEYYYCVNGKPATTTPSECPDSYFDYGLQACSPKNPNYNCCNSSSDESSEPDSGATTESGDGDDDNNGTTDEDSNATEEE